MITNIKKVKGFRGLIKIDNLADEFKRFRSKGVGELAKYDNLLKKLNELKIDKQKFFDDFGDGPLLARFDKNPELVKAWEVLDDAGVDELLRKNVNHLENVSDYLKKNPNKLDEFKDGLTKSADKDVFLGRKLYAQKLGRNPSSTVLGENLEAVGKVRPENSAAHHMVPSGHSNEFADQARNILKREGIDINEAASGAFLPKSSKYVIDDAIAHTRVHTKVYFEEIFNRLNNAPIGKVRNELDKIAQELLNGTFPY